MRTQLIPSWAFPSLGFGDILAVQLAFRASSMLNSFVSSDNRKSNVLYHSMAISLHLFMPWCDSLIYSSGVDFFPLTQFFFGGGWGNMSVCTFGFWTFSIGGERSFHCESHFPFPGMASETLYYQGEWLLSSYSLSLICMLFSFLMVPTMVCLVWWGQMKWEELEHGAPTQRDVALTCSGAENWGKWDFGNLSFHLAIITCLLGAPPTAEKHNSSSLLNGQLAELISYISSLFSLM